MWKRNGVYRLFEIVEWCTQSWTWKRPINDERLSSLKMQIMCTRLP